MILSRTERPGWLEIFTRIASTMSERSTCPRAQTGAVITSSDNHILATGYNGSPSYVPHCIDVGCHIVDGHCVRAIHSETNALLQAAKIGVSVRGGTIYCTHRPCIHCAKMIAQAGITGIVFLQEYDSDGQLDFVKGVLLASGVLLAKWDGARLNIVV